MPRPVPSYLHPPSSFPPAPSHCYLGSQASVSETAFLQKGCGHAITPSLTFRGWPFPVPRPLRIAHVTSCGSRQPLLLPGGVPWRCELRVVPPRTCDRAPGLRPAEARAVTPREHFAVSMCALLWGERPGAQREVMVVWSVFTGTAPLRPRAAVPAGVPTASYKQF